MSSGQAAANSARPGRIAVRGRAHNRGASPERNTGIRIPPPWSRMSHRQIPEREPESSTTECGHDRGPEAKASGPRNRVGDTGFEPVTSSV
ncbi:hypothetical protein SLNWT_6400 [Streptomyces albus]|uniref:Uncharacterized protein n=1 Tax=Streptomyces albus (strain ATCC 21838 / DSM 41398 / FERM P-419 / JCM 4703 / NBRC 107858) TaxID=1081613 RepID=A0A0B5F7D7_STRA4|nr:hypothetical protein SLNWT_6400 [Streptomyces albus]AOU81080.1 hypothetical protein SLNHY_6389 [Streptomyces albus]